MKPENLEPIEDLIPVPDPVPLEEVSILYRYQKGDSVKTGFFLSIEDVIQKAMDHLTYMEATPLLIKVGEETWEQEDIYKCWAIAFLTEQWDIVLARMMDMPWYAKAIELGLSTSGGDQSHV